MSHCVSRIAFSKYQPLILVSIVVFSSSAIADLRSVIGAARSGVSSGVDRVRESAGSAADHARDSSNRAREAAEERTRQARETAEERGRQARDAAQEKWKHAEEAAGRERQRVEHAARQAREAAERESGKIAESARRAQEATTEKMQSVRGQTASGYENVRNSARESTSRIGEQVGSYGNAAGNAISTSTNDVIRGTRSFTHRIAESSQSIASNTSKGATQVRASVAAATVKHGDHARHLIDDMADRYGDRAAATTAKFLAGADQKALAYSQKMQGTYGRVAQKVADPDTREKVVSGLVVAGAYTYYAHQHKSDIKYKAVKYGLQHTSLKINGQTKTAEQLISDGILIKAPFLAGTRIADDPAALLAYGVVAIGSEQLIRDTPLLPDGRGGSQSIEAAARASPSASAAVDTLQLSASLEHMAMSGAKDGAFGRHGVEFASAYNRAEKRFGE